METFSSDYTDNSNTRRTFYSSMDNKTFELTFKHGLLIGVVVTGCVLSVVMDKFFVSKETFNLNRIYVDGRIYKLCEDK